MKIKKRVSLWSRKAKHHKVFVLGLSVAVLLVVYAIFFSPAKDHKLTAIKPFTQAKTDKVVKTTATSSQVLGAKYRSPQIYLYGNENSEYSMGGVIEEASTDEPAVYIEGYKISGPVTIEVYQTNEDALVDGILHDEEGKQTQKEPNEANLHYVTTITKKLSSSNSNGATKVVLPLSESGIWFLRVSAGKAKVNSFVLRSNIGVVANEGNNEFVFWGQNFKTRRSIKDGTISTYSLLDGKKEIERADFNSDGIAKSRLTKDADVAIAHQGQELALVPLNLKYLNTRPYASFVEKKKEAKYFIFTDRPLYKPGDTVYFKAILRDDDDARYTIPAGSALVKIYNGYYYEGSTSNPSPEYETSIAVSEDGTVSGEYQIPQDAKVGERNLYVSLPGYSQGNYYSPASVSFDVQFFRKPEYSIDITTSRKELIAGDKAYFTIKGKYFSGQPLLNQKIKYTVRSSDFYEYVYLADQQSLSENLNNNYWYGMWYGNTTVAEGTATLNLQGEAEIDINTKVPFAKGKTQVFSIEATVDSGAQDPAFSRKNILVYAGEYGMYRKDYKYGGTLNSPISTPVVLVPHKTGIKVSGIKLTAKVHRENWVAYTVDTQKYPEYRKEEDDLPALSATTGNNGEATFTFTPKKVGSYTITVQGRDSRNNLISKAFYLYVSAQDYPYYNSAGNTDLSIATDKQKYQPGDTAKLSIYSYIPNRDVFLSMQRGRMDRFQVVHVNGKNATVDVPIIEADIPNTYANIESFDETSLNSSSVNIPVSANSKKLNIELTPNSKNFGPGESATVNVQTTDTAGNPVSADVAVWAVDKAIFELSDNKLGDIFDMFWQERYNNTSFAHSLEGIRILQGGGGGGCFVSGTKVLMAGGKLKNIEDVRIGDYVLTRKGETDKTLVRGKVTKLHQVKEAGYTIINGTLRVTTNHIMWVNNLWKEAGSIQAGDTLLDSQGKKVAVTSVEWLSVKEDVYNLEIEGYHTYFADNVWVHNDKGLVRSTFKDTAYWNPNVHTDASGRAQISFKLPDNLTTWVVAAVGSTKDTKVGQNTVDVTVTQSVIVRPILPNILRVGDEAILSALVQNFRDEDQTFKVDLKFDAGTVQKSNQTVSVKASDVQQVYWKVKATEAKNPSHITVNAVSTKDKDVGDALTVDLPVHAFGFVDKTAQAGYGTKTYDITLPQGIDTARSSISLSLAPTIIGALPAAMKYLVDYPYGCVEQTTSRFVPAVIAKTNASLFPDILATKDVDKIIAAGIKKLSTQQQSDGGWTWWFIGRSDPYVTSYVVEYLLAAQKAGAVVDPDMLSRAQGYLENVTQYYDVNTQQTKYYGQKELIAKNYGLALLGKKSAVPPLRDLEDLTPDMVSLVVMTNYLNGETDPKINGVAKLISMRKTQGSGVYWNAGKKTNFGSKDASTALALKALVMTGANQEVATKAAEYLARSRRSDYWSNTYATAQVVDALVAYAKTNKELSPNYTYAVSLDGKTISQDTVSSPTYTKDIKINPSQISSQGSKLSISKKGTGQIYSTLSMNAFLTDRNVKPVNHGISINREYVNAKGSDYSIGVGDTVLVRLTVEGLGTEENYAVVDDQLPAGLIPINETFKNQQYDKDPYNFYYSYYGVSNREVTENGMVLSLYQMYAGKQTYTYKARAISEGTFSVPPATVQLMYTPEIYARTGATTMRIAAKSKLLPGKQIEKTLSQNKTKTTVVVAVLLVILGGILVGKRKGITSEQVKEKIRKLLKRDSSPPTQTN